LKDSGYQRFARQLLEILSESGSCGDTIVRTLMEALTTEVLHDVVELGIIIRMIL
jgi:hypothetical protein